MTFRQLRNKIAGHGSVPIKWNKSGIVEFAEVTETGAIKIGNVITRKVYRLPPHYQDIDVTVLPRDAMVKLGELLPKEKK